MLPSRALLLKALVLRLEYFDPGIDKILIEVSICLPPSCGCSIRPREESIAKYLWLCRYQEAEKAQSWRYFKFYRLETVILPTMSKIGKKALEVHQALGDPTRYAIFTVLSGSTAAMTTMEIAKKLRLHPNTVRPHLDKLRSAGLLEVYTDRKGSVGRPANRYRPAVVGSVDNFPGTVSALQMLVTLMVAVVDSCCPKFSDELAINVGRQWALSDLERSSARTRHSLFGASGRLPLLVEKMADLGFAPEIVRSSGTDQAYYGPLSFNGASRDVVNTNGREEDQFNLDEKPFIGQRSTTEVEVVFRSCPYEAWSQDHSQLVCSLHRGVVEGYIQMPKRKVATEFSRRGDPQPCRVAIHQL